jgi:hypothetical protein
VLDRLPMPIKRLLATLTCVLSCGSIGAGSAQHSEGPNPRLSAVDALAIARTKAVAGDLIVALDWSAGSEFQTRLSDGTFCQPPYNHSRAFSWFVTSVFKAAQVDATGQNKPFNSVRVTQVHDDGRLGDITCRRPGNVGHWLLPRIPTPSVTADAAIASADRLIRGTSPAVLVGLDWFKPSLFRARSSSGPVFQNWIDPWDVRRPAAENRTDFAWFATYRNLDTSRRVVRVNDDGVAVVVSGHR